MDPSLLELLLPRSDRSAWYLRWLGLPPTPCFEGSGLVLLQIDGLSRPVLEQALEEGRMPFLQSLLEEGSHRVHTLYAGMPATTPAAQAELFYGVKCAVPAFGFLDTERDELVRMFEPAAARAVEAALAGRARGLLEGGSAYGDIYTGGADEAHFCAASIGMAELLDKTHGFRRMAVILFHAWVLVRVAAYFALDAILSTGDFLQAIWHGNGILTEFRGLLVRVVLIVVAREFTVSSVRLDVLRGLPVVHANFVGYDEQAHRRGPESRLAKWVLRGIDDALERIDRTARRVGRRDYQVWIHSDHGQAAVTPYHHLEDGPLPRVVAELLGKEVEGDQPDRPEPGGRRERVGWSAVDMFRRLLEGEVEEVWRDPGGATVCGMGPVGHLYLPRRNRGPARRRELAERLVDEAGVPMVLLPQDPEEGDTGANADNAAGPLPAVEAPAQTVAVRDRQGWHRLPDDGTRVLGEDHPFAAELAEDLVSPAHHPDAGELCLLGWAPGCEPVSFADENGTHATGSPRELHAFAMLPTEIELIAGEGGAPRHRDLRRAALERLGRADEGPDEGPDAEIDGRGREN